MNFLNNNIIRKTVTYVAAATLLFLGSCVAENFPADGPVDMPANGSQFHKPNSFVAFRIYLDDTSSTGAAFDSDFSDTDSFNNGLEFERALYFPDTPTDKGDSEDDDAPSQVDESEENTGTTPPDEGDGSEENKPNQSYHFAILFNTDGTLHINEIIPLELIRDTEKDTEYYTVYAKFYDPEKEENPFGNKFQGTVLIVLNASYDLEESIKTEIMTEVTNYIDIRALTLQKAPNNTDPDNFLYLKDKDGAYIKDKDGNKYFTMSSSMIISDNKNNLIPAIETTAGKNIFQTYPTEKDAKENPTSLYVERLQAKYTVIFNAGNNNYVYLANPDIIEKGETSEEDLETNYTRGSSEAPDKVSNLILEKKGGFKIVTEYHRLSSNVNRGVVTATEVTDWKINITGWGINGIEREEYLFKNLPYPYEEAWGKHYDKSFWYRNYWAKDTHYDDAKDYPYQQRRIIEKFKLSSSEDGSNSASVIVEELNLDVKSNERMVNPKANLDYYSYNYLSQKNVRNYVSENTFDASTNILGSDPFNTLSYLRVGSHLIVTAQLLIKGIDSDPLFDGSPNFDPQTGLMVDPSFEPAVSKYLFNDMFWVEDAYKEYVAEYLAYFMATPENTKIFGRNDGTFYVERDGEYNEAVASDFIINSASTLGGDNKVFIYPDRGVKLCIYNPEHDDDSEGYIEIFNESDPNFISQKTRFLNFVYSHKELMAERFLNGRMYYATGSYHFRSPSDQSSTVKVTDFGTVRNNWYSYTVDEINNPGTGVDIDDQPIVPNNLNQEAIGVSVTILPWHTKYVSSSVTGQHRPQ